MKFVIIAAVLAAGIAFWWLSPSRSGNELRLKHIVTIAGPDGERSYSSVLRLVSRQSSNYSSGGWEYGPIDGKLTGQAVRVPVGDRDFFFLLADPKITGSAARAQISFLHKYLGVSGQFKDSAWVRQWRDLAGSQRSVALHSEDYPAIAVMPRDGWMDDAKQLTLEEARQQGLNVVRYQLQITAEPVGPDMPYQVRFRPNGARGGRLAIGPRAFTANNSAN